MKYMTSCAVMALLAAANVAQAQDGYFAGKTVDVVVPFGQGGATYVSAKFLEPFFEKHLPGNPEVSVIDRPGGGSILGANWFQQNAKDDGTTLLFTTSSTTTPFVLGQNGVEYKLSDYRVAYSHPFSSVAYVSSDISVNSAAEIKNANEQLRYGGISAAASDLPSLLSFEVLDLDVNSILGFNGRGPVRLAFEQGELNLDYQFTPVYLTQVVPSVEAGSAVPLWTGGSMEGGVLKARDSIAPELPSVYEVYEDMNGTPPSGVEWDAFQAIASITYAYGLTAYAHPDTPQEVLDLYAAAVEAINADPEFQKASQEVTNGARLNAGPETEQAIKAALSPSQEVKDYLHTLLTEKFGVRF
ncbi:hypothetical protein PAF17_19475 [Paracoccus sp. Z330]|uniref:Tricarboxylate transporter n=1 Tax=Paracoccus onchidii TaxID=3017813 RepID=A0ABT4ZJX4_9RHOB|nr:hypothetical protein [Paracoccus onchidii]MDB6179646.1 hypothetical protein [Paracoccus onchidii]